MLQTRTGKRTCKAIAATLGTMEEQIVTEKRKIDVARREAREAHKRLRALEWQQNW